jgi:hypothetical protein
MTNRCKHITYSQGFTIDFGVDFINSKNLLDVEKIIGARVSIGRINTPSFP